MHRLPGFSLLTMGRGHLAVTHSGRFFSIE